MGAASVSPTAWLRWRVGGSGKKGLCWGLRPPSPPYPTGKMCSGPLTPTQGRSMSPCLRSQGKVGPASDFPVPGEQPSGPGATRNSRIIKF